MREGQERRWFNHQKI